jgi:FkbM family methyltransferase
MRAPVRFVQIGAADGRRADPIYAFVIRYGWQGVLCEPLPDLFMLLKQNYQGQEGLVFENVAITEQEEQRPISRIPADKVGKEGIPTWAFGASSLVPDNQFSLDSIQNRALRESLVKQSVSCISLSTLLRRNSIDAFDVLLIDTEGYDARVFRQLDLARYRPMVINMEWQWLTSTEQDEVTARLCEHGYHLYPLEGDMLATAIPLERMYVTTRSPRIDDIPQYFTGMYGLAINVEIDLRAGSCADKPVCCEVFGLRGQRFPLKGDQGMLRMLPLINGRRSYQEIASETGCTHEQVLGWAQHLIEHQIIES